MQGRARCSQERTTLLRAQPRAGSLGAEVLGPSEGAEAEAPDQQGLQRGNIRPDYHLYVPCLLCPFQKFPGLALVVLEVCTYKINLNLKQTMLLPAQVSG